ncbi:YibE/F family protein [Clostridium massiliamazoniense]|uniref:YibE/F family protein n=1 Tax=Clostridium massiliamazoniense TaxID=1347366 RepID=UPI0006D7AB47|nr:YibE/F family protein [Clostridium massiliamazoniense]
MRNFFIEIVKKRKTIILWTIFTLIFSLFLYKLNSKLTYKIPEDAEIGNKYEKAVIIGISKEILEPDPVFKYINIGKQYVKARITTGNNKNKVIELINFVGRVDNRPVKVGSKIVVSSYDNFKTSIIVNYNREDAIYILLGIFVFLVLLFGKSKGFKSLFSLIFTMILVIFLFIPLVIKGINPIMASTITVILSTAITMIVLNGLTRKTAVAIFSCILCTIISGIIALVFGKITNISTYNTAEAEDLLFIAANTALNVKNLLFSGILISSLGAIMDTTMSITSSIFEIVSINNKLTKDELFKSGMNIGKDIMGTMTNTLILAFTGSSVNILIMYFMYKFPYVQLINIDLIVIEVVQGLSGGIAVILSIPITAILASRLVGGKNKKKVCEKIFAINRGVSSDEGNFN